MDFPSSKGQPRRKQSGASFWTDAKQQQADLFASFVEKADEFRDLAEYTHALRDAAWAQTEKVAKRSWRNGVETGRSRTGK